MNARDVGRRGELEAIAERRCREERLCARVLGVRWGPVAPECLHALLLDQEATERLLWWGQMPARHWLRAHEQNVAPADVRAWLRRISREPPETPPKGRDGAEGVA